MSGTQVVTFVYQTWVDQYPVLGASVGAGQAQGFFDLACLYLDNSASSLVPVPPRGTILYLLTSHIATIMDTANPLVGRINNASEGSVSVAVDMPAPMSAAWFNMTKYGAMAYQALAPYRTGIYIAPPQVPLSARSYPVRLGWQQ